MRTSIVRRALRCSNLPTSNLAPTVRSHPQSLQCTRYITTSRPAFATTTTTASKSASTYKPATSSSNSAYQRSVSSKPAATSTQPKFSPTVDERPPPTARTEAAATPTKQDLSQGLTDEPPLPDPNETEVDWSRTFHGLGNSSFSPQAAEILLAPINADDVEVKPEGILYLPEIKYRRILNRAFGPGSWGLAPRGETIVTAKLVTREYGLIVNGRLISIARGEQQYFDTEGIPTATEGCKSNALMRCCKDIGIASELWDPRFIRTFMKNNVKEMWAEHVVNKKKRKMYIRKDDVVKYPFQETK